MGLWLVGAARASLTPRAGLGRGAGVRASAQLCKGLVWAGLHRAVSASAQAACPCFMQLLGRLWGLGSPGVPQALLSPTPTPWARSSCSYLSEASISRPNRKGVGLPGRGVQGYPGVQGVCSGSVGRGRKPLSRAGWPPAQSLAARRWGQVSPSPAARCCSELNLDVISMAELPTSSSWMRAEPLASQGGPPHSRPAGGKLQAPCRQFGD